MMSDTRIDGVTRIDTGLRFARYGKIIVFLWLLVSPIPTT
jgi:hypothetical protein